MRWAKPFARPSPPHPPPGTRTFHSCPHALQRFLGHHSVTFTLAKDGSHFSKGVLEPAEYLTDLEVADFGDPDPGAAGSI